SFIIHSESTSKNDAPVVSTAEADPGKTTPNQTKYVSKGLKTVLTQPTIRKGASSIARQVEEEETSNTINDEYKEDEIHTTTNAETEDTLVPKSSLLRSSQIQDLTNQVLILQSQKHKLELEKNQAKAALLKAQPSFLNIGQLNELMAKLKTLDALLSLLNKVTNLLNQFAQAIASKKTRDESVPSVGQVGTQHAEGSRTQIKPPSSSFFKEEMKRIFKKKPEQTTTKINSPNHHNHYSNANSLSLKSNQNLLLTRKGKAVFSEEVEKESTHMTGSMVESFTIKKLKRFNFISEDERNIHLTKE
nr:hypothetical protein [Tanacetum cinerariifolium]